MRRVATSGRSIRCTSLPFRRARACTVVRGQAPIRDSVEGFEDEIRRETRKKRFCFAELEEGEADWEKLQRWFARLALRDFFGPAGRAAAEAALARGRALSMSSGWRSVNGGPWTRHQGGSPGGSTPRVSLVVSKPGRDGRAFTGRHRAGPIVAQSPRGLTRPYTSVSCQMGRPAASVRK
jgi:hypothetical protein